MFNIDFDMKSQPDRQEKYIQYLYSEIDVLKQKLNDSELQCKEYSSKLRNSEKICDEKEQFILFRESQLIESEDIIYKLKKQVSLLSHKMSTSRQQSRPSSRSSSRSDSRRRSLENISLDTLPTPQLFYKISTDVEELLQYATGTERLQNIGVAQHLRDRIIRASELIGERYDLSREEMTDEIARLGTENYTLSELLQGVRRDIEDIDREISEDEQSIENLERELAEEELAEEESEEESEHTLDTLNESLIDYEHALEDLQRELELAGRRLAERDVLLEGCNYQLRRCREEGIYTSALYRAEQILTRRLTREKRLLKMINRQRQIELNNVPVIAPQPINQIWLLL